MSKPKTRFLLFVGFLVLGCAALMLSGCARFDGIVDFTADLTSGKAPLSVQFTPACGMGVRKWIWSFGDGQTSTERSPEHTYAEAGTYNVILMVVPRREPPASVIKEDYITVHSGFGSPGRQLWVQDDEFDIPGDVPSFVNSRGRTMYVLDVLENDVRGDGGGQLTIVGVRPPWSDTYEEIYSETDSGSFAWINLEGTAIEYDHWGGSTDTFYYLATDGLTTAEGEVTIEWWTPLPGHTRLR